MMVQIPSQGCLDEWEDGWVVGQQVARLVGTKMSEQQSRVKSHRGSGNPRSSLQHEILVCFEEGCCSAWHSTVACLPFTGQVRLLVENKVTS